MPKLSDKKATRELVGRYGFDFRKRFGQNFLVDENVILRTLEAADITKDDVVIEIGPGIGTLTQYLAEAAFRVIAVEIDRDLVRILQDTLSDYDNVEIINKDVLKVDLNEVSEEYRQQGRPLKIAANLPYYITTPILMHLFGRKVPAESVTVMVQQEVAERMTAGSGTKEYGALSLAVQYYSRPEIVMTVPPSSFYPPPKVTSAVVHMQLYRDPPVRATDEGLLMRVIRAAFGQRRKTLVNALSGAPGIPAGKEKIAESLRALDLPPAVRGEALDLEQFARLTDLLSSC